MWLTLCDSSLSVAHRRSRCFGIHHLRRGSGESHRGIRSCCVGAIVFKDQSLSFAAEIIQQEAFYSFVVVFVKIIKIFIFVIIVVVAQFYCWWLSLFYFRLWPEVFGGGAAGRGPLRASDVGADGVPDWHEKIWWEEYSSSSLCLPCAGKPWPHLPHPQREPLAVAPE